MARPQHTHSLPHPEEALTVLLCLTDDAWRLLAPEGATPSSSGSPILRGVES
jgi:hypothetical protein